MSVTPIVEVKHLEKEFGFWRKNRILKDVNFAIMPGEFHAFIGQNGAGKTTTIKCLISSYQRFKDEINIDGISNKNAKSKGVISYIPEYAVFPKHLNTHEYLYTLGKLSGCSLQTIKEKVDYWLARFQIEHLRFKKPNDFSSGQKKKVLLIQALFNDPKLLIMDEPTANLDPKTRNEFMDVCYELNVRNKMAVFVSSHILAELENYCDSLTVIHEGEILFNGKTKNIAKDNFGYRLKVNNSDSLRKWLKAQKIAYKYFPATDDFQVDLKQKQSNKFAVELYQQPDFEVFIFVRQGNSLQNIYNNLIEQYEYDQVQRAVAIREQDEAV